MEHWTIFGETLAPGEKRQTAIRVSVGGLANDGEVYPGQRQGSDYKMPAILVNGLKPGRTLLVTAGIFNLCLVRTALLFLIAPRWQDVRAFALCYPVT